MQVVSDRADKSILVAIDRWQWLAKYKKEIKRTTKLMAHDEDNECRVGDLVQVQSSRWGPQAAYIYLGCQPCVRCSVAGQNGFASSVDLAWRGLRLAT